MISENVFDYCYEVEKIENYELALNDETQIWDCHHRKETDENLSADKLIELGLYCNRPASELIFLTPSEHHRLHKPWNKDKRNIYSEETLQKLKEKCGRPGEQNGMYGKKHSDEVRQKISEATKLAMTDEARNKMSEAKKGKHWKLVDGKRVWY